MKKIFLIAVLAMIGCLVACGEQEGRIPEYHYEPPVKEDPRDDPDPIINENIRTEVIAHRGYWKACVGEKVAENTVRSLIAADALGVYGAEFDLHLTSDGVVVAGHDATVTIGGKTIKINDKPYSYFKNRKLDNGEVLPTLDDFLKAAKNECKSIKLIIELKCQSVEGFNKSLTEKTIAMVKEMGLQDRTEYISFEQDIVELVHKLDPTAPNAYLFQYTPMPIADKLKAIGATCLDSDYLKTTEADIKNVLDGGLKTNVWTVDSESAMRQFVGYGVNYITTNDPELAIKVIEAMKRGK